MIEVDVYSNTHAAEKHKDVLSGYNRVELGSYFEISTYKIPNARYSCEFLFHPNQCFPDSGPTPT